MPTDYDDLANLTGLSQKDRIQILLNEYSTLRSEAIARTGFGYQIAAVALAGITWFMQQPLSGRPCYFWIIMIGVVLCFGIAAFVDLRDLSRAARRIAEIEHEVNSRAGEHLLVWETLGGLGARGKLATGFFSMVKTLPRSKLPALDPTYLEGNAAIKALLRGTKRGEPST